MTLTIRQPWSSLCRYHLR